MVLKDNITSNISFKSRIVFTSPEKFAKIFNSHINESNFVREPWNLSSIRSNAKHLGTSGINNCTGFSLNSYELLLGHLMTSEENISNLDKIKSFVEKYIIITK